MTADEEPWYRTQTAVVAAGGLGLVLVVALFAMVVRMSGEWENPPPAVPPAPLYSPVSTTTASIITPSTTSTSYSTAPLSTSEIPAEPLPADTDAPDSGDDGDLGDDPDLTTTTTTSTTAGSITTETTAGDEGDGEATTTTRWRPRFNQTRTPGSAP